MRRLYNTTGHVEPAEHLHTPPDCFYFTTMLTSRGNLLALGVLLYAPRSQRTLTHSLLARVSGNLDAVTHLAVDLHRQRDDVVRRLPGRLLSG